MNYFHDMVDNIHQKRIWRPWNQCGSGDPIEKHTDLLKHGYVELAICIGKGNVHLKFSF